MMWRKGLSGRPKKPLVTHEDMARLKAQIAEELARRRAEGYTRTGKPVRPEIRKGKKVDEKI